MCKRSHLPAQLLGALSGRWLSSLPSYCLAAHHECPCTLHFTIPAPAAGSVPTSAMLDVNRTQPRTPSHHTWCLRPRTVPHQANLHHPQRLLLSIFQPLCHSHCCHCSCTTGPCSVLSHNLTHFFPTNSLPVGFLHLLTTNLTGTGHHNLRNFWTIFDACKF